MDPKILAAVFASIAALTMSGTGSMEDIQEIDTEFLDGIDGIDGIQIPSEIEDILRDAREGPEPENRVHITAEFKSVDTEISTEAEKIMLHNFTEIKSEARSIDSDESVDFRDYKGSIVFSNGTTLNGVSQGLTSSGVNLTERLTLEATTDASRVEVTGLERNAFELENVDTEFESETGTTISDENAPLNINSFTGNLTVHPLDDRIVFDGLADTVEVGSTSFTG